MGIQGIQVSRLIRIRYGNIKLMKGLPRGGWEEMDLENVNYYVNWWDYLLRLKRN